MASIVNFVLNLRNNVSGPLGAIRQGLNQVTGGANQAQGAVNRLGAGIGSIAGLAASAFSVYKIAEFGKEILSAGMNMEQTRVQFETFTGSAEKGNAVIAQLQKFSLATPFDDDQVIKAGKSLLAFGETTESLQGTLTKIGNISSATGKDFNELTTIYGKARTAGTLYAEDINQLVEAGIPIIDEFAKQLGVPTSQVKKLASQGKISFSMLQRGFEDLGGASGKWGSLMEKQSKTVEGRLSSLKGFAQNLGSQLGEAMLPFAGAIIDRGTEALQWVKENKAKFGAIFQPLLTAVRPLTESLKRMYTNMGLLGDTGSVLERVFNGIGFAIKVITPAVEFASNVIASFYDNGVKLFSVFSTWIQKNQEVKSNLLGLYNVVKVIFTGIADIVGRVFGGIVKSVDGLLNRDWKKLGQGVFQVLSAPTAVLTDKKTYAHLDDKAPAFDNFFAKSATDQARSASDAAKKSAGTLAAGGSGAKAAAGTKSSTKVGDVSGTRPTTINVTIQRLIGVEKLETRNVKESYQRVGESLTQVLTSALTDFQLLATR